MKKHISIIGSGMSGCLMALCLAKEDYKIDIYEARSDIRKQKKSSGRSFNITLYTRGIIALQKIDLWKDIKKISVLTKGNVAHYLDNRNIYDPYDSNDTEVLYTVNRNILNSKLLDIVEKNSNIKINFNTRLENIDKANKKITLRNILSKRKFTKLTDLVIGADGVNSTVRKIINNKKNEKNVLALENWGYKEVQVTPQKSKLLKLKSSATHTWPRRNSLFIAFPNPDKSNTLMINLPLKGENSFETLKSKDIVTKYIVKNFPDLKFLLPEIVNSFLNKPTGKFTTILTNPWHYRDFILLIGDAAHGVIPFYGQGVCAAMEDCLMVSELMKKYSHNLTHAFKEFEENRKIDTDTLAILARDNFIELRDKSRSLYFIIKDKVDTILNRFFPKLWLPPLYILIAHGTITYDRAYRLYSRQLLISRLIGLDLLILAMTIPWFLTIEIKKRFK
ncbi:MAG TPA: NAD(P)/FAD-dependent oxidoreductase [Candidatus Limnocylindrales bacterium]|nr:NAD(P)/FAD-dependent oxidoreductase [Candidatus Limnocylindrales bacterium]